MAVNKVVYNAKVLLDLTSDTVTPDKLANGVTAHDKSGNKITGTMATNTKSYEITLPKNYGWILLTALDDEVLEHINDANLIVSLVYLDPYSYEYYSGRIFLATNIQIGNVNGYPAYGMANKQPSETQHRLESVCYPANNTGSATGLGGTVFRVKDGKYYIYPSDGYVVAGRYRLTFTW